MDCCRDQISFFVSENIPESVHQIRNLRVQSRNENHTGRREWNPQWIGTENRNDEENNLPPELFQKKFMASARPIRAILQVSAMEIYSIALNGRRKMELEACMPDGKIYRTDGGSNTYRCLKCHSALCGV